jgi:ribosomal protein L37E
MSEMDKINQLVSGVCFNMRVKDVVRKKTKCSRCGYPVSLVSGVKLCKRCGKEEVF